ncbi:hypothetical protein [Luteococcus peritonei]|uniref:Uncharacterized protein n=1 Tax=Luteococcus peritonei TaxID=88874 RepID=A0ABW4RYT3_9ACTN
MRVYARPGWRMARQLLADLAVVAWLVGWALVGRWLCRLLQTMEQPARRSAETAQQMAEQMEQARGRVAGVPGIGDELASPFGSLVGGLDQMVTQAQDQVDLIHRMSLVAGWLVFLLPALSALAWWLPRRARFVRRAAAARAFIDADADLELFALRAMANLPMDQIAQISPDPVGQWRAGNSDVIRALAARELERTGLAMPAPVRPEGGRISR